MTDLHPAILLMGTPLGSPKSPCYIWQQSLLSSFGFVHCALGTSFPSRQLHEQSYLCVYLFANSPSHTCLWSFPGVDVWGISVVWTWVFNLEQKRKLPLYTWIQFKCIGQDIEKLSELEINSEKSHFTFEMWTAFPAMGTLFFCDASQML